MRTRLAILAAATVLAAWAVAVMASCAGGDKSTEFRPAFLKGEEAVIYVFRPREGLIGGGVSVFVNQDRVGELGPGQYWARVVTPGEYLVRVEGSSSAVVRARLIGGESAFLRVRTGGLPAKTTIEEMPSAEGQRLIAQTSEAPVPTN